MSILPFGPLDIQTLEAKVDLLQKDVKTNASAITRTTEMLKANENQTGGMISRTEHQRTLHQMEEKIKRSFKSMDARLASEILVQNKQRENLPSVIETKLTLLRKYFTSRYYPLHQALSLHFKIHPKRVYLPAYEIGAEANPAHFAPVITREITMLEIKELRLNDAAFVLSNTKWTYAKLVEKNK